MNKNLLNCGEHEMEITTHICIIQPEGIVQRDLLSYFSISKEICANFAMVEND